MLGELPVPPHSSELVLFWGQRGWEAPCHLRAFTSASPGKQRETRERASKKRKLMRVTSAVWEVEFPFLQGIPPFRNGLLFSAGSKPTSFGISYEAQLEKDEQILCCQFVVISTTDRAFFFFYIKLISEQHVASQKNKPSISQWKGWSKVILLL